MAEINVCLFQNCYINQLTTFFVEFSIKDSANLTIKTKDQVINRNEQIVMYLNELTSVIIVPNTSQTDLNTLIPPSINSVSIT